MSLMILMIHLWLLKYQKFFRVSVSQNIRKVFFWENIKNFLMLESESSISRNKTNFWILDLESSISWNIRHFFEEDFQNFFEFLFALVICHTTNMMKMKMKMKNRSHRYDINRPKSRRGHKYSKCKKCVSMIMLLCIKEHLSNTWTWIHENVKQH